MKKFILPIFLFSFIFLIDNSIAEEVSLSSSLPNSCEAIVNKNNVTRVKGIKDGKKFSHINHCANDNTELVKFSCDKSTSYWTVKIVKCKNGCKSRKCVKVARAEQSEVVSTSTTTTTSTSTQAQQTEQTTAQSSTTVSVVTQEDSDTLFEYDITAHKLAMLDDFVILANKIFMKGDVLGNGSDYLGVYTIANQVLSIIHMKNHIIGNAKLEGYLESESFQTDIHLLIEDANLISDKLFEIASMIKDMFNDGQIRSKLTLLEVNEYLAENQKILNEKLELLKKLTTIKIPKSK